MNIINNLVTDIQGKYSAFKQSRAQAAFVKQAQEVIRKSNADKDSDAPSCLILQAAADWNGAFIGREFLSNLKIIGKTHRIVLKILDTGNVREAISKAHEKMGPRLVDCLWLRGHGNSARIRFGEGEEVYEDISQQDFVLINPKGKIILESCSTGTPGGIAQRISIGYKGSVYAPGENSYSLSFVEISHKIIPILFDDSANHIEQRFRMSRRIKSLGSHIIRELFRKGYRRTPNDNFLLGMYYTHMSIKNVLFLKTAIKFYKLSMEEGHEDAKAMLCHLVFYRLPSPCDVISAKEIAEYAKEQVKLGIPEAQYRLGALYSWGEGVERSDYEAGRLYALAARQGHRDAQIVLEQLVYSVSGQELPFSEALDWFEKNVSPTGKIEKLSWNIKRSANQVSTRIHNQVDALKNLHNQVLQPFVHSLSSTVRLLASSV